MEINVLDNIREEHELLQDEMRLVQKANGDIRRELFDHIKDTLVKHLEAIEEVITNRLQKNINTKEHHELKEYLQRLTLMHTDDQEWIDMFRNFQLAAIRLFEDEEKKLFDELKEDYSRDELIEIGTDYVNARAQEKTPEPS